ncbi:hypothetical protein PVMG_04539 [Plasmodium vivax Mauritania I]|uniref:PIR Superfamily Protein n=2 Tax=Plasmodium vivax TaxID=5855 RepID=A0A0J9T3N3_PLAVI|nr:hypothetical protein PVBG_04787 [Plasmodium vivax Brazil I]KMZ89709.1 hypothetical protein PVMG_04539 [Plasmodium vivax Mauritania I]
MKHNIPNHFIKKCFENSKLLAGVGVVDDVVDDVGVGVGVGDDVDVDVNKNICHYYPYDKFINVADDMLKINIFVDNISTIQNILKNKSDQYNCLGMKFLYDCFNIYKKINDKYCSKGKKRDTINICPQLELFRSNYNAFIPSISNIPENIKSLNAEVVEFTDVCPLNESKREFMHDEHHSTGSSGPSSTTTALSTVVGASSALALLYKV